MKKLKKINIHFYIIFLLFFFALFNKFPENYFFAGGDNWQIVNFENHFAKWGNTWSNENNGYPNTLYGHNIFYYPFYLINKLIAIRSDVFALIFHFFFNLATFYSFLFFLNSIKVNLSNFHKILISFTYTANIFSFYLFWYSFSYTPYSFNFIFFPLIFSIFWNLIENQNNSEKKKINPFGSIIYIFSFSIIFKCSFFIL